MASNRYLAAVLGAAITAGATGSAVYQAATQSDARNAMGAGTSNVSLPGTGVVVTVAGDAGTLDAAGAPDGAVATLVNGAPQWAAASGGGPTVTTLYASDCTAESGSYTASISGTGAASTWTLSGTNTSAYGTGVATSPRIVCALAAGLREVELEIGLTSVTGMNTSSFRYLGAALRNAASGGAPTALWGASINDNNQFCPGSLLTGAAGCGGHLATPSNVVAAADRWTRWTFHPRAPFLGVGFGTGSGGARPTVWVGPNTAAPLPVGTVNIPDTASATAVVLWLSHLSAGTTSLTGTLTVRAVTQ